MMECEVDEGFDKGVKESENRGTGLGRRGAMGEGDEERVREGKRE